MSKTRFAVAFTTKVPMDVLREKLTKIKYSVEVVYPNGYIITSCHLDAEMCELKGFGTEIPDLLKEIFGDNYVCETAKVFNDIVDREVQTIVDAYDEEEDLDLDVESLKKNILNREFQNIIDTARSKVYDYNNKDFTSKMFIITNGELGNINKEVGMFCSGIVIL